MNERSRHREVLGETASVCPHCGGGPMVVTRSWRPRRLTDLLDPRFDPDVVHREVCTACSARFPIGAERVAVALLGTAAPVDEAPVPSGDGVEPVKTPPAPPAEVRDAPGGDPAAAVEDEESVPAPARAPSPVAEEHLPVERAVVVDQPAPARRRPGLGAGRRSGPVRRSARDGPG